MDFPRYGTQIHSRIDGGTTNDDKIIEAHKIGKFRNVSHHNI